MKYAVIKTGGKQYKVSEGDLIEVERLAQENGNYTFDEVLLYVSDGEYQVGTPTLDGVFVKADIQGNIKGDKIRVSKFKAKARYRRVTGHRQALSAVKITEISTGAVKSTEAVPSEAKVARKPRVKKV